MLRSLRNENGIMGLTLSQIGLMVASGILIVAVFSVLYLNDWQRTAELKGTATQISTLIEGLNSQFFENAVLYRFSDKNYQYNISISTEYIIISAKGNRENVLSAKKQFSVKIWPQSFDSIWIGSDGLHDYLKHILRNESHVLVNTSGNVSDPVSPENFEWVQDNLSIIQKNIQASLAVHPMYMPTNRTVIIEKAIIYYDSNGDGTWNKDDDKQQEFIFIYNQ
ncbi:MAG: hypothetical protein NT038_00495 [Euryarchaeota archaeon]|nr:hypothetical protein [Euryarchaeota archaeon]